MAQYRNLGGDFNDSTLNITNLEIYLLLIYIEMKKYSVILMIFTIMSVMSCENSKKSEAVDKAAAESTVAATPKMKVIVARLKVKEGQEAAFISVASVLVEATRKEPGCLFYTLYQSPMDTKSFIFYEEYEDQAAFDYHSNSDHFKTFAGAIGDMLDGGLDVGEF